MIHGHGDDTYDFSGSVRSNFSSNIWPGGDASALDEYLCRRMAAIHSYPEPDARSFCMKLSDIHGLTPECFCATNGATEAIYLVAQAFRKSVSTILIPTFSEYEDACKIHDHSVTFITELADIKEDTEIVWLCDPNNPTGRVWGEKALSKLVAARPETLFVIDQSYAGFTTLPLLEVGEAVRRRNVIVIRSMTKRYAIPGLRLGYVIAHPDRVAEIAAGQMPWAVNALAAEAGIFLLDTPGSDVQLVDYLDETNRLQQALTAIDGLEVLPGETPFFLCRLENRRAAELKKYLAEKQGLLIRDAANFRGLDKRYFRICTQKADENDRLVEAVKSWMSAH